MSPNEERYIKTNKDIRCRHPFDDERNSCIVLVSYMHFELTQKVLNKNKVYRYNVSISQSLDDVFTVHPTSLSPFSFNLQFRFASKQDKLLIYVAVVCSVIHGISYPAMVVLFAKAIEQFVNHGKFDRLLDRVPDFLAAYNMSKSETRKHLDDFE